MVISNQLDKVDLRKTLATILETQLIVAEQEGISIAINGPEEVWTLADEKRITSHHQSFEQCNKYAEKAVEVCFKEDAKDWHVHIIDDGPGVPLEAVPHYSKSSTKATTKP